MPLIKIQSYILGLVFIVLLSGCSNLGVQTKVEKENLENIVIKAKNSKLIVLDVYHNRCETCKFIEPVFEKLKSNYSQNPEVAFLKYDLSNPFTVFKSKEIAKALDIENIYRQQRYSGIVIFIDSRTKQIIGNLIGEDRIQKYREIIENKLKENAQSSL